MAKDIYHTMDTLTKYKRILSSTIKEYATMKVHRIQGSTVTAKAIIDHKNGQYLLMETGWENRTFCYNTVLYFELNNQKVWIQQNNTDVLIADELVAKGIAHSDIVLGFIAPEKRQYTGFAAV